MSQDDSPADEAERSPDERRADASRTIGRAAAWSLGLHAFALATFCGGLPVLSGAIDPRHVPPIAHLAVACGMFAALACVLLAFGAAVAAAVTALLNWSLLPWPRRALGLAPLLAFAGDVVLIRVGS